MSRAEAERRSDILKPVATNNGVVSFHEEKGEMLRTWTRFDGGEKLETTYGATETEALLWKEIIRLRTALHESADLIRKLSMEEGIL